MDELLKGPRVRIYKTFHKKADEIEFEATLIKFGRLMVDKEDPYPYAVIMKDDGCIEEIYIARIQVIIEMS